MDKGLRCRSIFPRSCLWGSVRSIFSMNTFYTKHIKFLVDMIAFSPPTIQTMKRYLVPFLVILAKLPSTSSINTSFRPHYFPPFRYIKNNDFLHSLFFPSFHRQLFSKLNMPPKFLLLTALRSALAQSTSQFVSSPGNSLVTGDDTIAGGIFCIPLSSLPTYIAQFPPTETGTDFPKTAGSMTSRLGPYSAQMIIDSTLPSHTIYAPKTPPPGSLSLPFIAWQMEHVKQMVLSTETSSPRWRARDT